MNSSRHIVAALLMAGLFLFSACRGTQKTQQSKSDTRAFPTVQVPSVVTEPDEIADYIITHFWDSYMATATAHVSDSTVLGGVEKNEMVRQIINYASLLENSPLDKAQKSIVRLMDQLESIHDASPALYDSIVEMVSGCMYDVNSELRDEDIYLPFVQRLAVSPYTPAERVAGYSYDAEMCSLNAKGTPAADFLYTDSYGHEGTLYGIDSEYTVLIFVNPGCHACGEVVEPFSTDLVMNLILDGRLTVMGMYIDEEVETWMRQREELPAHWLNAYDPQGIIRTDQIYSVRAIPSIYVLDRDKKVIMKDAIPQRAMSFLASI